ncbi:MAG: extensin family protein [Myxococcota bacterium]
MSVRRAALGWGGRATSGGGIAGIAGFVAVALFACDAAESFSEPSEIGAAVPSEAPAVLAATHASSVTPAVGASPSAARGGSPTEDAVSHSIVDESEDDEDGEDGEDGDGYYVVGPPDPIPDCEAKLEAAGVEFSPSRLPLHKTKSGMYCGAQQVVRYAQGPGGIRWGGRPKVTCAVALAMARLETIVQEEAEREFGRPVQRIKHMGTYNCREMANYPGWVSEHSYANAIDIKHFELRGGKTVPVLGEYPKNGAEPKNAKARFLQQVARRLYDERVFSVVLTPSFDRAHRNHFHLDMARYLVDGT